ncbi:MAG: hypothetical protein IH955_00665, partial [Chloroflexi bacterium]|nr:hypothetical protein [Chloroflexota bacterium]
EAGCLFTDREVAAAGEGAIKCGFNVAYDAPAGDLTTGDRFSIAYLGNEDLVLPTFIGSGPFEIRLRNTVLDLDNADGDSDRATGITGADINVVDGPDGGIVDGIDLIVTGFDPHTNVVSFAVQKGESIKPGDSFTVQYLNKEDLAVPATSEVTQQRLYLEAIEEILPEINKIIVSPDAESVLILGGREGLTPIPLGPSPAPQQ